MCIRAPIYGFLCRNAREALLFFVPILITYPYNEENNPDTRDIFLYCAQHTLGSHAKIVNAANYGNLFTTGPAEFIRYNNK